MDIELRHRIVLITPRYCLSTAKVESMAVSHYHASINRPGVNFAQTNPHAEDCPSHLLRSWYHICAHWRAAVMGQFYSTLLSEYGPSKSVDFVTRCNSCQSTIPIVAVPETHSNRSMMVMSIRPSNPPIPQADRNGKARTRLSFLNLAWIRRTLPSAPYSSPYRTMLARLCISTTA